MLVELDGRTWLRTGDIVVVEDGGFLRLVDRIKEVIITGGFNVYPSQVEDHLREMPEIADVAVVGLPGGDLGERVVAAIVLAEGTSRVELAAVRAWSERAPGPLRPSPGPGGAARAAAVADRQGPASRRARAS